jgi:hypothetical protein
MNHAFSSRLIGMCLLLTSWFPANSQELNDVLSAYTGENGQQFAQPLGDAIGAGLNSGFYHSAKIPKMGFSLEIGVSAMFAFVPDAARTYDAFPEGNFQAANPQALPAEAPTIFGSPSAVQVEGEGGTRYSFPGGLELKSLPLAVPQIRVGAVFGTDLTLRYFASDLGQELGNLNLFGFGVRHSISQYLPAAFPLQLAVGYYNQNLRVDNLIETQTNFFNAQASFKTGPLVAYTGLGYNISDSNISYTYDDGDFREEVAIDLERSNSIRALLGVALELGPVYLSTDYNLGDFNVWNIGLGLSFGK